MEGARQNRQRRLEVFQVECYSNIYFHNACMGPHAFEQGKKSPAKIL